MENWQRYAQSKAPYDSRYIKKLPEDNCEVAPGALAEDGSLLRPFIVFFGESVPMIEPAAEVVHRQTSLLSSEHRWLFTLLRVLCNTPDQELLSIWLTLTIRPHMLLDD